MRIRLHLDGFQPCSTACGTRSCNRERSESGGRPLKRIMTMLFLLPALLVGPVLVAPANAATWKIAFHTKDVTKCWGFQCGREFKYVRVPSTSRKNNGNPFYISSISARNRIWKNNFSVLYHDSTSTNASSSDAESKWAPSSGSTAAQQQSVNARYDGAFQHNSYSWYPRSQGCLANWGGYQPSTNCSGGTWSVSTSDVPDDIPLDLQASSDGDDMVLQPCDVHPYSYEVDCVYEGPDVVAFLDEVVPGADPRVGPLDASVALF